MPSMGWHDMMLYVCISSRACMLCVPDHLILVWRNSLRVYNVDAIGHEYGCGAGMMTVWRYSVSELGERIGWRSWCLRECPTLKNIIAMGLRWETWRRVQQSPRDAVPDIHIYVVPASYFCWFWWRSRALSWVHSLQSSSLKWIKL